MKPLLVAVALAILSVSTVNAETVSFSYNNPLEITELNQTGALGFFNSNLGVLTGVQFNAFGEGSTTITLLNSAAQTQTVSAESTVLLNFFSSDLTLGGIFAPNNPFLTLSFGAGVSYSIASGELFSTGLLNDTDSRLLDSSQYNGLLSLQTVGDGTFDVTCRSISQLSVSGGGGNILAGQSTMAGCGAEIIYSYDATPSVNVIPEPGSLALLGLGFVGLMTYRRKV